MNERAVQSEVEEEDEIVKRRFDQPSFALPASKPHLIHCYLAGSMTSMAAVFDFPRYPLGSRTRLRIVSGRVPWQGGMWNGTTLGRCRGPPALMTYSSTSPGRLIHGVSNIP